MPLTPASASDLFYNPQSKLEVIFIFKKAKKNIANLRMYTCYESFQFVEQECCGSPSWLFAIIQMEYDMFTKKGSTLPWMLLKDAEWFHKHHHRLQMAVFLGPFFWSV